MERQQATRETDVNYEDLPTNAPWTEENIDEKNHKPILENKTKECQEYATETFTTVHLRDETHI